MYTLSLIGIGSGGLSQITQAAKDELAQAELILLPDKGEKKADLINVRKAICSEFSALKTIEFDVPKRAESEHYLSDVNEWHDAIAAVWQKNLDQYLPNGGHAALLIWGDPSLYDSSLRIAERLQNKNAAIALNVIPGITSLQALTAAHAITLNELAAPVLITTGRRLREEGWPHNIDTVAVLLDGECSFQTLPEAVIRENNIHIWWGAYVGMKQQSLLSGALSDVVENIIQHRAELRRKHGWIMDVYLLKALKKSEADAAE